MERREEAAWRGVALRCLLEESSVAVVVARCPPELKQNQAESLVCGN